MFLTLLNPDQQRLFLVAARRVAEQDGKVADVEQALLDAVLAECRIDEDPGDMSRAEFQAALSDAFAGVPHSRNAFMLELAGVAVIDGDAHPAELSALAEIGDHLGVADASLARFVEFAMSARDLVVRGRELVASGDSV